MALPSSGTLSINDISIEVGSTSGTTASLKQLSTGAVEPINERSPSFPNPNAPYSISEWYGYDSSYDLYYWLGDGVNDTIRYTGASSSWFTSGSQDLSWCGWYRIDETTDADQFLGTISTATPSGNNMIFIQYTASDNALKWRYRDGGGGNFHQVFKSVNSNSSVTGVTSGGWTSTNRGNTNQQGFVFLTFTYDASDRTAATGMKIYWNGAAMTTNAQTNSRSTAPSWGAGSIAVGDAISASPNNAAVFKGGIDLVSVHSKVLTQSEITALYNNGAPIYCTDAGVTSNLLGEYRMENNANVSGTSPTLPNLTNTGGVFTLY